MYNFFYTFFKDQCQKFSKKALAVRFFCGRFLVSDLLLLECDNVKLKEIFLPRLWTYINNVLFFSENRREFQNHTNINAKL